MIATDTIRRIGVLTGVFNDIVKTFTKKDASSYKDAMHKMCIPCHKKEASNPV